MHYIDIVGGARNSIVGIIICILFPSSLYTLRPSRAVGILPRLGILSKIVGMISCHTIFFSWLPPLLLAGRGCKARVTPFGSLAAFYGSASQGLLLSASVREGPRVSGRGLTTREGDLWKSICWKISSSRRLTSENKLSPVCVSVFFSQLVPFFGFIPLVHGRHVWTRRVSPCRNESLRAVSLSLGTLLIAFQSPSTYGISSLCASFSWASQGSMCRYASG